MPSTVTATIVPKRSMNETNFKLTLEIADIPVIQLTTTGIETMAGAIAMTDGEMKTETTIEAIPITVRLTTSVIGTEWRLGKKTVKRESRSALRRTIATRTPITVTTKATETKTNIRVYIARAFSAAILTAIDSGDNSRSTENSKRITTQVANSVAGSLVALAAKLIKLAVLVRFLIFRCPDRIGIDTALTE